MVVAGAQTTAPLPPQTVELTLYTHGSRASDILPASRNGIFIGHVWLDGKPLTGFLDSLLPRNDRYIVFRLPAGTHVLATGDGRHPEKDSLYETTWQPGEHIFLRIHEDENALGSLHRRFQPMPCAAAASELKDGKVLGPRAVQKDMRSLQVPDAPLPVCP